MCDSYFQYLVIQTIWVAQWPSVASSLRSWGREHGIGRKREEMPSRKCYKWPHFCWNFCQRISRPYQTFLRWQEFNSLPCVFFEALSWKYDILKKVCCFKAKSAILAKIPEFYVSLCYRFDPKEPEQFEKTVFWCSESADNSLIEHFKKWATLIDRAVMRNLQTKCPGVFSFVTYFCSHKRWMGQYVLDHPRVMCM